MQLRVAAVREHRVPLVNEDDLRSEAERRASLWAGTVIVELASEWARVLLAREVAERDLIPRAWIGDQPTAYELLRAVLNELEEVARRPKGTVVGAHQAIRRLASAMGVHEADRHPGFRLTRAEIEDRRTATWEREQRSPTGTAATRSAAEGRQR